MEKLQFTKEIKDNWLKALTSGDFVQGTVDFEKVCEGVVQHCCLGVLCVVLGLPTMVENDSYGNWSPIHEILPNNELVRELYKTNDSKYDGKYTSVIPLIENLKTTD